MEAHGLTRQHVFDPAVQTGYRRFQLGLDLTYRV
jgi:hypothetical protein